MFENPYLLMPSKGLSWSIGFWAAYFSSVSPEPTPDILEADYHAFNEGVAAGAHAAMIGLPAPITCVSLRESSPSSLTVAGGAVGVGSALYNLVKLGAGGIVSVLYNVIKIGYSLPTHFHDPESFLRDAAPGVLSFLGSFGVSNAEVFVGAGVDTNAADSELIVSSVYPSLDQARQAAQAFGRPEWLVVSWRSDQSSSFSIVDSSSQF